jgi:hypothetical protein
MKRRVVSELKTGSKTAEDLRRTLLGERPTGKGQRQYDTRYQALRRAVDQLVKEGLINDARYVIRGDVADTAYLAELIKRNAKTADVSRLEFVMEEVQSECGKVGAIRTSGLVTFLHDKLNHPDAKIRELAIGSLRYLVSNLNDGTKDDRKIMQDIAEEFTEPISKLAGMLQPISVRAEAIMLLAELGLQESIDVLTNIVKTEPEVTFKELYSPLKDALCHKYDEHASSKNRLMRDHKSAVHQALLDLLNTRDQTLLTKRVEPLLWHFKTGGLSHYPTREPY